ncbi:hypothetical protein [Streptomyces sp. NPDC059943]|uniref:DUF7847 domain-containing protein n=1 Tax=Streptomyces sp. NPDC059943 TaxID=3347010 RepID=UPI00366A418E
MTQDQGWGGGARDGGPPGGYGPYGGGGPPPYGGQPPPGWGPPPYGSGPPPGWGGWSRPRGPKPGVIPLSPLDLGEILGGAFSTLGRYWRQLLGIALAVFGVAFLLAGGALAVAYAVVGEHLSAVVDTGRSTPARADVQPLIIAFVILWVVVMAVLLLATAVMQACCPAIVQEAVLGRPVRVGATLLRALSRVPAVLGTVLLSGLIMMIPVLLFITGIVSTMVTVVATGGWDPAGLLIPLAFVGALVLGPLAVWLWVLFSLAPAVVVIESRGPLAALRRSVELVRGSWWRICGISLLAFVIASVAGMALQQLFNVTRLFPGAFDTGEFGYEPTFGQIFVAVSGYLVLALVGQLVGQIFSTTFPQLVLGLLYIDQRIRKEDLAPALIAASASPAASPGGP